MRNSVNYFPEIDWDFISGHVSSKQVEGFNFFFKFDMQVDRRVCIPGIVCQ